MSHQRKRPEPWITRTKRELAQEDELLEKRLEGLREIRKQKRCHECRRYDEHGGYCTLDDLAPCKFVPKI